jgi:hypothetical protein
LVKQAQKYLLRIVRALFDAKIFLAAAWLPTLTASQQDLVSPWSLSRPHHRKDARPDDFRQPRPRFDYGRQVGIDWGRIRQYCFGICFALNW